MLNKSDDKKENEKMKKQTQKREGFFRKVIKSIKDFDKYEDFGIEGISKTVSYLTKLVAIFTLVITIMALYKFSNTANSAIKYFDENIKSLSYTDGTLIINDNQKLEINSENNITGKMIIDTSNLNDEQIEEYKNEIKERKNGIVILKDRALLKNEMLTSLTETSYKEILSQYNIIQLDKQTILDYFNNNQFPIYLSIFATIFIYMFVIYIASILIDALVLGVLGFITARVTGMKIRFGATFSMGVHALTLPIILNILYVILNGLTGYTIKYFQFMYTAISYIYVITAILIIKSDYIKRQAEVQKIQSEQERIHAEIEAEEQERQDKEAKNKEEKEKQKQKDKERKEQNKKQNDKQEKQGKANIPDIGGKPEGSNV